MKNTIAVLAILSLLGTARADVYDIDPGHAEIGFAVKHLLVSNAKGKFKKFTGTITLDADNKLVGAETTIDAASIDTNNEKRDKHLLNEDFFNVEKFPNITFKSTKVESTGDSTYNVTGNLNVLGKDHEITFPAEISGPIEDPWGNTRLGMETNTKLDRRELGITYGKASVIADTVKVELNIEAIKQQPKK